MQASELITDAPFWFVRPSLFFSLLVGGDVLKPFQSLSQVSNESFNNFSATPPFLEGGESLQMIASPPTL